MYPPDGLTADTACPYCGKKCGHGNIDQTTGLCPECGYQMAASLTVDGKTTFFDTFPNAAAAANGKTGALLTLLKDEVVQNSILSSFGGGKITIDWKGHTLSGQPDRWNNVIALDAAELTCATAPAPMRRHRQPEHRSDFGAWRKPDH